MKWSDKVKHASEVSYHTSLEIEDWHKGNRQGLITGFPKLDHQLGGGLMKDIQWVIAARPGQGKTTFLNTLKNRIHQYNEGKYLFLFFTFEMNSNRLALRDLSNLTGLTINQLRSQKYVLNAKDFGIIEAYSESTKNTSIYYIDVPMNVEEIHKLVGIAKHKHPDKHILVCLDHIFLTKSDKQDPRLRVIEVSNGMMMLKKEFQCTTILLSQLSRKVEDEINRMRQFEPNVSHLKEASNIEEDADIVTLLHRPSYYNFKHWYDIPEESCENQMRLLILKNRDGDTNLRIRYEVDFASNSLNELP